MLTFKDLVIKANDKDIENFISALTERLSGNPIWSRSEDKENNVLGVGKIYAFKREKDNKLPSAGLSLFPKDKNISWYVPNVVPLEYGQLSYVEYNGILTEFFEDLVNPIASELGIRAEITSGAVTDVDILGEEAAQALTVFSNLANKSTGSSHPCDRERWLAFIYEVCTSGNSIDVGLLERLLIEQGWDEERAIKLVIEFEFGRDLIGYIREHS